MPHIINIESTLISKPLASASNKRLILQVDILVNDVQYIVIVNDTESAIKGYNSI